MCWREGLQNHRTALRRSPGVEVFEIFADVVAVLMALPASVLNRHRGPAVIVSRLRSRAVQCRRRSPEGRARLRRVIGWVDRFMPGGPNCYRRVLLQIQLDGGAAEQPIHFGLMESGAPGSGHVWLEDEPEGTRRLYDAEIVL